MPRPSPRVLRRLAALLLGTLLGLLAAEGAYRLARGEGLGPTTNPHYVSHDPRLGWRYRPGISARHATGEFDVLVEIGRAGFRAPFPEPDLSPGRRRVLVLGDSFAFGWGVQAEEALPGVLAGAEPSWQVFNAAVSGYGTDQQLLLLAELLPRLRPTAVVSVFCANDLQENVSSRAHGHRKPWFAAAGEGLELRGVPVPRERFGGSQLVRALVKHLRPFERGAGAPKDPWALTVGLYQRMEALLGVPLVIVSDEERLAELARSRTSVHHVHTGAALAELGPAATFPRDGHWTTAAHRAVGELVVGELRRIAP